MYDSVGMNTFIFTYCKTLTIREDFIFALIRKKHPDAKIKSSLIISNVRVIEEDMKIRENKVS